MKIKSGKVQDIIDEQFLKERKIFLWGEVEGTSAKHVMERLVYLDAQSNDEIQLFINSPGGFVTDGFAIYDTMQSLKSPVSTICTGLAASMGSILLSGGAKGRRFIQKHAKVMIHQPSGGGQGTSADLEIMAEQIHKVKEMSAKILADNCGQPVEKIMKDFDRDHWMGAKESVEYGIVDKVIEKL